MKKTQENKGKMIKLNIDQERIKELGPLYLQTVISAENQSAVIVTGKDDEFDKIGQELQKQIAEKIDVRLELIDQAQFDGVQELGQNIIAFGHVGNNKLLERMHYLGYIENADYREKGLKVISIHNPLGDGHNVIAVLGYTVQAARNGGKTLIKHIINLNGRWLINKRLFEIEPTVNIPDMSIYLKKDPSSSRSGARRFLKMLYYLKTTGKEECARAFIDIVTPYATGEIPLSFELMSAVDFWTDRLVIDWDFTEEFEYFLDEERLMVANFIAACTQYCNDSLTYQKWRITEEEYQIFNHHTYPASGLYFGSMYLRRHGYEIPEIDGWLEKSGQVFNRAAKLGRSFDESGHYSFLVGNTLLKATLANGDSSYAKSDELARYVDMAIVCQNNFFESVPFGDSDYYHGKKGFASLMLLQAAYWQNNGNYKWVAEKSHPGHTKSDVLSRSVEAKKADKYLGLYVLPLDEVFYRWLNLPMFPGYPEPLRKTNVELEKCFDKISMRSGWEKTDDYILLQGLGGGAHSHPHTNSISQYQANERLFIIEGDYIRRMPWNHNMIMVIRDGSHDTVPVTARLDSAEKLDGSAITQSTVLEYNGCDWQRSIIWLENDCAVVIDSLKARIEGDYEFRCYWRTLGDVEKTESGMYGEQSGQHFYVTELTNSERRVYTEPPAPHFGKYPKYRYGKNVPYVLSEKQKLHLKAGEETCYINLLLPNGEGKKPRRKIEWDSEGKMKVTGGGPDITIDIDGLAIKDKAEYKFEGQNRLSCLENRKKQDIAADKISAPDAKQKWKVQLPSPTTAICSINGTEFFVGREDGSLLKLDSDGNIETIGEAEDKINSVMAGRIYGQEEITLIATGEDSKVRFFSESGKEKLTIDLKTLFRLPAAGRALCLADLDGDGKLWPIVGTRDWAVHAIKPDGTFRWTFNTTAHCVSALSAGDINNDGKDDIAVGTVYFCVPVITGEGKRLWQDENYNDYWRAGPIFPFVEIGNIDGEGDVEVIAAGHDTLIHCISSKGEKKWTYSFGDEPKGMVLFCGAIAVASATGDLHLVDKAGERIWRLSFPKPCSTLSQTTDGQLCVGLENGEVFWVNKEGEVTAWTNQNESCNLLYGFGEKVLIADTKGGFSLWEK